jgi:NAD(P)H-flavin reductase
VLFDVPLLNVPDDIQPRAFSIASAPAENDLLFIVKLVPSGRASLWFENVVNAGSHAVITGPFGLFVVDNDQRSRLIFVATGTGIAPFRSHIMFLLTQKNDARSMDLFFGVRTHNDLFWIDELKELEKAHPRLQVHVSLTQGDVDWHGHTGRLQEIIPQVIKDFSEASIYICGAPDMVKEIKQCALEQWSIEKKDVHIESYV